MIATGICIARNLGYAYADHNAIQPSTVDYQSIDPATALVSFRNWFEIVPAGIIAVCWPMNPPQRYRGIFQYLNEQDNVRAVPPSHIKLMAGGHDCTVKDIIQAASRRCPGVRLNGYEEAVAALCAQLATQSVRAGHKA